MGILKSAADTVYAFRFIRMMVMDWKNWDAYKEGLIDENGKRNKDVKIDTSDKRSAYTPFVRLVANIKRLVAKLPGGGSKLGSFASALYLVKEKNLFFDRSETHFLEMRLRRSTSTAMNATNAFPGNSFTGDEENPISGRYPILDTCRIGL